MSNLRRIADNRKNLVSTTEIQIQKLIEITKIAIGSSTEIQIQKLAEIMKASIEALSISLLNASKTAFVEKKYSKSLRLIEEAYQINSKNKLCYEFLQKVFTALPYEMEFACDYEDECIRSVDISPDENYILIASDYSIKLWSRKRELIHTFKESAISAKFSPNGKYVLACFSENYHQVHQTILWKIENNNIQFIQSFYDPIKYKTNTLHAPLISFSYDSQKIISVCKHNGIKIWDIDKMISLNFEIEKKNIATISSSPTKNYLAIGYKNGELELLDFDNNSFLIFEGHNRSINSIVFSKDGFDLLTASDDSTAKLWNTDGILVETFQHRDKVKLATFSAFEDYILTLTSLYNHFVKIWSRENKEESFLLEGHSDIINTVSCSTDEEYIITTSKDNTLKVWSILEEENVHSFQTFNDWIFSTIPLKNPYSVLSAAFYGGGVKIWNYWKYLRKWYEKMRYLKKRYAYTHFDIIKEGVSHTAFSSTENIIVYSNYIGEVFIKDIYGFEIRRFEAHKGKINFVAISPNSLQIATAGEDTLIKLWHIEGEKILKMDFLKSEANSIFFSPCGAKLLAATKNGTVFLCDLKGNILLRLNHNFEATYASFSPNGQHIVVATSEPSADNVIIWDVESGEKLESFQADSYWVHSAIFSPDSTKILTASDDTKKHLNLWNLEGKLLQSYHGHEFDTAYALFKPDGKSIISVSRDNTIKIWDIGGKELCTLYGHEDTVKSASISFNGDYLVTVDVMGISKLWVLDIDKLIHQSNQKGIAFLTANEMQEHNLDDIDNVRGFDRVSAILEENQEQRIFQFALYYMLIAKQQLSKRKEYLEKAELLLQKLAKQYPVFLYKTKLEEVTELLEKL